MNHPRLAFGMLPVLAVLWALPSCASLDSTGRFERHQVVQVFLRWREAERRRDFDLAREVLYFEKGGDEDRLRIELASMQGTFGGPVLTELEVHLTGHPEDWGPGDYLFLEPRRGGYGPTRARFVSRGGKPCIVYEPPLLFPEERERMSPEEAGRLRLRRRIAFWQGLEGEALAFEVERLRTLLRYQQQAEVYAGKRQIDLMAFDPAPGALLALLAGLDPEEARKRIVAMMEPPLR